MDKMKRKNIYELCELLNDEKQLDVSDFMHRLYSLKLVDYNYMDTLKDYNSMEYFELVDCVNEEVLLAILTYAVRLERIHKGTLDFYAKNGDLARTLNRLKLLNESELSQS